MATKNVSNGLRVDKPKRKNDGGKVGQVKKLRQTPSGMVAKNGRSGVTTKSNEVSKMHRSTIRKPKPLAHNKSVVAERVSKRKHSAQTAIEVDSEENGVEVIEAVQPLEKKGKRAIRTKKSKNVRVTEYDDGSSDEKDNETKSIDDNEHDFEECHDSNIDVDSDQNGEGQPQKGGVKKNTTMSSRMSPWSLFTLIPQLTPEQRRAVGEIGFGSLLTMQAREVDLRLGRYLVENFHYPSCTINLEEDQKLQVNVDDAQVCYNLPRGPGLVVEATSDTQIRDIVQHWRNRWGLSKGSPKTNDMCRMIVQLGDHGDDFKRDFVILAASSLIRGNQNRYCRYKLLASLGNVQNINQLDWCRYVLTSLSKSVAEWQENKKRFFTGPMLFLNLCYLDRVEFMGVQHARIFPSISIWTNPMISKRVREELKVGFGKGRLLGRLEIPKNADDLHNHPLLFQGVSVDEQQGDVNVGADIGEVRGDLEHANEEVMDDKNEQANDDNEHVAPRNNGHAPKDNEHAPLPTNELAESSLRKKTRSERISGVIKKAADVFMNLENIFVELAELMVEDIEEEGLKKIGSRVAEMLGDYATGGKCTQGHGHSLLEDDEEFFKDPGVWEAIQDLERNYQKSTFPLSQGDNVDYALNFTTNYKRSNHVMGDEDREYDAAGGDQGMTKNWQIDEALEMPNFSLGITQDVVAEKHVQKQSGKKQIIPNEVDDQLGDDIARMCLNKDKKGKRGSKKHVRGKGAMVKEIGQPEQQKRGNPPRRKKVGEFLRSPYFERKVSIDASVDKTELAMYQFAMSTTLFTVYEDFYKERLDRIALSSMNASVWIENGVVDAWSWILNYEEARRSHDSIRRVFFKCYAYLILDEDNIGKGHSLEDRYRLFEETLDLGFDKANLIAKESDMLVFPVFKDHHYFLVCFNLKRNKIVVLDNKPHEGDVYREKYEYCVDILKIATMTYLEKKMHPKARLLKAMTANVPRLEWQDEENNVDCGVYVMRHMETYMGTNGTWDSGLQKNGRRALRWLRIKYCVKILLHDTNIMKDEIERQFAIWRKNKDDGKKK